ncbi:MAG: PAS domain S-box protein [Daejeonella sp.]|uniref:response regulator n=1 Tax=Daejeonella sp. TaxID=2805397 RepID=UPI0027372C6D|nr:PAS domain S-box protein [Daejeonella sp.]MDP3468747.1 PAS domain S-box protein [Daejeonella sp.]
MPFLKDKKPYRILVVEDNPGDFTLVEDYILEYIIKPQIVNTRDFYKTKALLTSTELQPFDIIFLDLSLPDKDGEDLIREMLLLGGGCPIVVLTGFSDVNFSIKSLALGISDYLLKDDLNPTSVYKSIIYNIERKKSLLDMQESEKRYSDLFHLNPEPMWVFDFETLQFLDVNNAAIQSYGYSLDEFMSMTIKDIRPAEDISILNEAIEWVGSNPGGWLKNKFRHLKKNGEIIIVEIKNNSILFKGRYAQLILAHNITERVNYINAIEEQNQKLSEISWMQSHVVRAPIARLMGLIDLIKHPTSSEELKEEILGYILISAHELDQIVREITRKAEEVGPNLDNLKDKF